MPEPEKIAKQMKTSQKGASGSGKPKKFYVSLQEKIIAENIWFNNIEPSIVGEEILQRFITLLVRLVSPWILV